MTPEEQLQTVSTTNQTLRLKLRAAEEENKKIGELAALVDEYRTLYFGAQEKLTKALFVLEKLGALNEIEVKPEAEREQENDAKTPQAERGFTR